MLFSKWTFRLAGVYGLFVMIPQYFLEKKIGLDRPPAITHPEYFYGFVGLAVVWQVVFLVISTSPEKYRALMIPSILEKLSFGIPAMILYAQGRLSGAVLVFGFVDLTLGALFAVSWVKSIPARGSTEEIK